MHMKKLWLVYTLVPISDPTDKRRSRSRTPNPRTEVKRQTYVRVEPKRQTHKPKPNVKRKRTCDQHIYDYYSTPIDKLWPKTTQTTYLAPSPAVTNVMHYYCFDSFRTCDQHTTQLWLLFCLCLAGVWSHHHDDDCSGCTCGHRSNRLAKGTHTFQQKESTQFSKRRPQNLAEGAYTSSTRSPHNLVKGDHTFRQKEPNQFSKRIPNN